jgi:CheY-like chemotaxis protein
LKILAQRANLKQKCGPQLSPAAAIAIHVFAVLAMAKATKKILIADDNPHLRKALCRLFENHAFLEICAEAVNGREAVEMAVQMKPDLIILDLSMPVMNGLEAARILNELMPAVPKILFTLHAQALMMADLKTAGIDRVVAKSDMTELIGHSENLVKAA